MFKESCGQYWDYDLPVMPINGKRPIIEGWQHYCRKSPEEEVFESWVKKYPNKGIGLCLGPNAGVVAIDIDKLDHIDKVPYSPLVKVGKKGETRFFCYNNEQALKRHDLGIEILSLGNQTVLPPTIHPETNLPYTWKSWLPVDRWDELPLIPVEFLQWLNKGVAQTDGYGGRNDYLKTAFVAMVTGDGKNIFEAIPELIKLDEETHEKPLFTDKKEFRTTNAEVNATTFCSNIMKSLGTALPQQHKVEIVDKPIINTGNEFKKYKLNHFRGIAGDIFNYIYKNSRVPRTRLAAAATISTMSLALSNKFAIANLYSNTYCIMVCPSGGGKNDPLYAVGNIFQAAGYGHFIEGERNSGRGVIEELPQKRERLDTIDEASGFFRSIGDQKVSHLRQMGDLYNTLYTATGRFYKGKQIAGDKRTGASGKYGDCYSPCVSILAASEIGSFIDSFSKETMKQGMGGRLWYFIDDEIKKPRLGHITQQHVSSNIVYFIKQMMAKRDGQMDIDGNTAFDVYNIPYTDRAIKLLENLNDDIYQQRKKLKLDDVRHSMLNRHLEVVQKLAMFDVVATQYEEEKYSCDLENLEWAQQFADAQYKSIENFVIESIGSSEKDRTLVNINKEIDAAGPKGISHSALFNVYPYRNTLRKKDRQVIIDTLVDSNAIAVERNGNSKIYYSALYLK